MTVLPRRRTLVVLLTGVLLVLGLLALVLNVAAPAGTDQTRASQVIALGSPLVFTALGGFLVVRRRRHPAGWMLGLAGVSLTLTWLGDGVVHQAGGGTAWAVRLLPWGAWLDNCTWPPLFVGIAVLMLRFPDGQLAGRRWRWVETGCVVVGVAMVVLSAAQTRNTDFPAVVLPLDLGPLSRLSDAIGGGAALFPLVLLAMPAAVVSLVLRLRRATGPERAQVRWLFWAAALVVGALLVSVAIEPLGLPAWHDAWDVVVQLSVYGLPIAVVVAVNRYGLFEIDRVIGRTVSYSVLTALLTAVYVAIVTAVSALVPAELGSVAVVAATLAVAALFVPARRRVQDLVDRRFNRARFDADGVVAAFAERTRTATGQATTAEDLVIAVRQVYQPAHVSVWLAPARVRS